MEVIMAMKSEIQNAIRSRLSHFKQHSDSLTLEGVRRLLEKDLVLQQFSLDPHKTFINNYLFKCLEEAGYDYDARKSSAKMGGKVASTQETEEANRERQSKDVEDICPAGGKKAENLQRRVEFATEVKEAKDYGGKVVQREALIKKAVTKRSSFIKANSEIITMVVLHRLLEEDLQLDKFALDPYKKFINQQVDEILKSSEVVEPSNNGKKSSMKKPDPKVTKKASCEENLDASNKESGNGDEVKPRKEGGPKAKLQASVGAKKRKRKDTDQSSRKKIKSVKSASRDDNGREDNGDNSKDQLYSSPEVKMASKNPAAKKYNQTKDLRCSTRLLNEKFQNMSEEKKANVRELGFDSLMHIPAMNLPHKLLKELAYSFDVVRNRLDTRYGLLTIDLENIGAALGLDASGDLFPDKVNFKELFEEEKEVYRRFQGKTLKNLTDLMMDIGVDTDEDRLMSKRVFILYVQMAFLLPTTINKVSPIHMPPIFRVDTIREWNWGGHVLEFLIKGLSEHHLKKKKSIDGCLYALMIVYFHESKHKNKDADAIPGSP